MDVRSEICVSEILSSTVRNHRQICWRMFTKVRCSFSMGKIPESFFYVLFRLCYLNCIWDESTMVLSILMSVIIFPYPLPIKWINPRCPLLNFLIPYASNGIGFWGVYFPSLTITWQESTFFSQTVVVGVHGKTKITIRKSLLVLYVA